jgi:hypothetical protein
MLVLQKVPIWLAMSGGRSTSLCAVVAAPRSGPLTVKLADLSGLIRQIFPTSKHGIAEP